MSSSAIEDMNSIPILSTNDSFLIVAYVSYKKELILRIVLPGSICVRSNRMPNHECKYISNFVSVVKAFIQKTQ